MNRTIFSLMALLLAMPVLTGCGEKLPEGMPKLYPTMITITQEGEPLEGALIQLFPEDDSISQWGPSGLTNASGVVELRTNAKYKGAPLGNYKVTIIKRERDPHPHPEWAGLPPEDPNSRRYVEISRALPVYDFVEPHFGSLARTPLRLEVTADQKNHSIDAGAKTKTEAVTLPSASM